MATTSKIFVSNLLISGVLLASLFGYALFANSNSEQLILITLEYPGIDKLAHYFLHFGVVGILYILGRKVWPQASVGLMLVSLFLLSVALSVLDEFQQLLVAYRNFDPQDMLAGLLGAMTAAILLASRLPGKSYLILALVVPLVGISVLFNYASANDLYYKAGLLQMKNGNYAEAHDAFLEAIQRGLGTSALYNELAWLELEYLGANPASAVEYSYKAVQAEPENADFLDTYGWALFKNKKYQQALVPLQRSYELKPSGYCINFHLGAVYQSLGRQAQALSYFNIQLELNNKDRFADKTRNMLSIKL